MSGDKKNSKNAISKSGIKINSYHDTSEVKSSHYHGKLFKIIRTCSNIHIHSTSQHTV